MISFIKSIYRKIRFKLRDYFINKRKWSDLKTDKPVIVASDCTGGMLYHDLRKEFLAPTINMFFSANDYIKFLKDPERYFGLSMEKINQSKYEYPLAKLGDITLHLVHYKSVEEAQIKWRERAERFRKMGGCQNMFCIMNDRNWCTEQELIEFDNLPYKNKVVFTHVPHPEIKCAYYIKGFEDEEFVGTMTKFVSPVSIKRVMDQFDFVDWINKGTQDNE